MFEASVQEEISQIQMQRPHVVILGAGASYAAFPNGDKNGRKLPLMDNFVEALKLSKILSRANIDFDSENFEAIYDKLYQSEKFNGIRVELEEAIYDYFLRMAIPDEPTIYDHLLLSLRGKDVIATFNWDPLLVQAYRRNCKIAELPRLIFLHGNVAIGYCEKDKVLGINGNLCSKCHKPLIPTKLLYPIGKKNYEQDSFVAGQWKELSQHLKNAFMITFFGYGAPETDVSAVKLMKAAWGEVYDRNMEQTEIIDIKTEDALQTTWSPFIHSHHVDFIDDFYKSWIAKHPRRTGEAYINQYIEALFIEDNPISKELSFSELYKWFRPLLDAEKRK
jgi:hypothetical protein